MNLLIFSENETEAIKLIQADVDAKVKDENGKSAMRLAAELSNRSKVNENSKNNNYFDLSINFFRFRKRHQTSHRKRLCGSDQHQGQ